MIALAGRHFVILMPADKGQEQRRAGKDHPTLGDDGNGRSNTHQTSYDTC